VKAFVVEHYGKNAVRAAVVAAVVGASARLPKVASTSTPA
jgi:hypothetical protein